MSKHESKGWLIFIAKGWLPFASLGLLILGSIKGYLLFSSTTSLELLNLLFYATLSGCGIGGGIAILVMTTYMKKIVQPGGETHNMPSTAPCYRARPSEPSRE